MPLSEIADDAIAYPSYELEQSQYDKLARNFYSSVALDCAFLWLTM